MDKKAQTLCQPWLVKDSHFKITSAMCNRRLLRERAGKDVSGFPPRLRKKKQP